MPRATPLRVLAALASAVAALLITLPLYPHITQTRYSLFLCSAIFGAAVAGTAAGTATLMLGLVLAELFVFTAPDAPFVVALRVLTLSAIGIATILLLHWLNAARLRAEQHARTSAQFQRAALRAEKLQNLLGLLLDRLTPVSVAAAIADDGRRAVDASAAVVVVRRETGELEVAASHGYPAKLLESAQTLLEQPSPLGEALRTGEPVWLTSPEDAFSRFPAMAGHSRPESCAWAAIPLVIHDRLLGAVGLSFDAGGEFDEDERAFMLLLAQQCAQAMDRARLHQLELEARVRAECAERRLALLAEVSGRLGASLDFVSTLNSVAWLAVPEIADWCVVHLVSEAGEPQIIALAHPDPDRLEERRSIEQRFASARRSAAPYGTVLRTGEPVHIPAVTDDHIRAATTSDEHFEALRALGLRSQIAVPIHANDEVCGVLTLAHAESGRVFTAADVTLAVELGRRAGVAVYNSRTYVAAQRANEIKSDFLAVMSHELRTPLNAIIGYTDLLLLGVPSTVPDPALRQIERIRGASTSLLHLVEEILSFSRVEAGKEELRISPVDIGAAVAECVAMVQPMAAERNLFARYVPPAEPVRIVTDERKVRQIVTNLLSNAVKFTESGGTTATVRLDDGEVQVVVTDSGIGISAEHHERIFEPFWQVEPTTTRRFGGTGLGLGVARKLATLLEGRLGVRSVPGEGSTFVLSLPLHTPGLPR